MARRVPHCDQSLRWLRDAVARNVTAGLTEQDEDALSAFSHLLCLYTSGGSGHRGGGEAALEALRATLLAMRPEMWGRAQHLIVWRTDESYMSRLWHQIAPAGSRTRAHEDKEAAAGTEVNRG